MKYFSLSWKVFLLLILFLVIPLFAWYGTLYIEKQLESVNIKHNQQQLKSYHGFFQKLLAEDSDFAQQLLIEQRPNQVSVAKRQGPILLDGYADEWFPYQNGAIQTRNDQKASSMLLVEDKRFFYGLLQIQDNQLVYQKDPYSSQSSDMIRLDLGYGYWLFKAIAPGRINVLREYGDEFRVLSSVLAIWQETQTGYQIEFRVPKALVGDRVSAVLYDVDDKNHADYNENYQGVFTFTDFNYFPLSREKNTDWLLGTPLSQQRLTITNKAGQVIYRKGSLFNDLPAALTVNDNYQSASKIDNAFTRSLTQQEFAKQQSASTKLNFIARSAASLSTQDGKLGTLILENSLQAEKSLLQSARWIGLFIYLLSWLVLTVFTLKQIRNYRSRINALNRLTEQANEANAEMVDLSGLQLYGNDEVDQLYSNLTYYNERLEQRREHQQKLLARLNHELRTPLAIIGSSIDNLALSDLDSDDKQLIQNARSGLERLSLSFSRLSEANRLEESIDNVSLDWFELNHLLGKLTDSYANTWSQQVFQLKLPEKTIKIRGAEDLFAQMMDKIISNAVDFSIANKPIEITLDLDNKGLKLSIVNYGATIAPASLKAIFNLMESQRDKKVQNQPNLGLGLYIAKLIARRHKAKIQAVNSPENKGVSIELKWSKKSFVVL